MNTASRTLALLAIFFADRVSLVGSTGNCPGTYGEYMDKCFKFVTSPTKTWAAAYTACHGDEDGWLATLDTYALATGVITEFDFVSISADVYFGLSKTEACSNDCAGKLVWDARNGTSPSNTGHEANMKSYALPNNCCYIFLALLMYSYLWQRRAEHRREP